MKVKHAESSEAACLLYQLKSSVMFGVNWCKWGICIFKLLGVLRDQ
jgi:hypothetical protein